MENENKPVSIFKYRGYEVPIYMDEPGQQYYCIFDDHELGFGAYNVNYQDDLEYLIDQELDTIYEFKEEDYWGAHLEWFNNGGCRDIQLRYRNRILKVFLITDPDIEKLSENELEIIKNESINLLKKVIKK